MNLQFWFEFGSTYSYPAAMRIGIFGAPSFLVNGELFWGNDRLADALSWAVEHGRPGT